MRKGHKGIGKMLRWKLRLVMAEKNISGKELAQLSGLPAPSISRLKVLDQVGQVNSNTLDSLCNGLTKAYRARGDMRTITPNDLLEFTFDGNGDDPSGTHLVDLAKNGADAELSGTEKKNHPKIAKRSRSTKSSPSSKVIQFPTWRVG